MIKSMTGFGRCEKTEECRKYTVEMKSVNHRYLEINIKMPRAFNFMESRIRTELKKYVDRGKVDLFISYEDFKEESGVLKYNKPLAAEYLKYFKKMAEDFQLENDVRITSLSRYPDVLTMEEQKMDEEELWNDLQKTIQEAAEKFIQTRVIEGEHLKQNLLEKIERMFENIHFITERSPEIIKEYHDKLTEKVKDMLGDAQVDENRLLTEVTIFADKVCIDEELVRLKSHIETTQNILLEGGCVGRKLDFIAQEMNREANTILSKTTDLETSNHAIELKNEIEKIREQIQNIE